MVTFAKRSKQTRVQKSITGIYVSADHEIASEILKSPNWLSRPLAERLYVAANTYTPEAIHPFLDSIIAMDGPDHRRVKKLMSIAFSKGVLDSWKTASAKAAKELVDSIESQTEIDFVSAIANPLPLEIISEIIGVPVEYREQCNEWGKILGSIGLDIPKNNKELQELEDATVGLTDLFAELLKQRRADPKDDLLSALAQAQSDGEQLTDREIIASTSFTLIAGFETTANLLSVGTLALLENPDQLMKLASNRDLLPNFIEEALRISSPIQFVVRTADSNMVLADGTRAKAGQAILLNLAGANRDPLVFQQPDEFRIDRENARKNIAFGFGAHHCIGSVLARVEAEAIWAELLNRFPNVDEWKVTGIPVYRSGKLIKTLDTLPMRFGTE
jgi:cytochrome P450